VFLSLFRTALEAGETEIQGSGLYEERAGADRSWAREVGGGGLPVLPLGGSGGPGVRRVIYGNEGSMRVAMERVTKLPRHADTWGPSRTRGLGPALSLFLLRSSVLDLVFRFAPTLCRNS
jgi:hypothetical protein